VLEENKRTVETMPFEELELALLRHWAAAHTFLAPKKIEGASAEALREALDASGRFLLHRIQWFETVEQLGGLHVIGTERHESRRIDNQLRGRSGRQGDRGSTRFFVSLEDDLMKLFAGEAQMKILSRLGMKEGDSIEHPWLSKSVERAQRKVEERNFQIRKNILEYDEVMEHQRQRFYGLRQRVIEGRDTKGLVLDYIDDSVADACDEYLNKDYPLGCVSEYARQKLETAVAPENLRGMDAADMDKRIRDEAKADARSMVDVTLGEYIPDEASDIEVDFDIPGLIAWARSRFGVELTPQELESAGLQGARRHAFDVLTEAAEQQIDETDLSGIDQYLVPNYGVHQLVGWFKNKFDIDVNPEEVLKAKDDRELTPRDVLMKRARELYHRREVEYPVEFQMDLTMLLMRQNPQYAASALVKWVNQRFGLNWTEERMRSTPPMKVREELLAASEQFVTSGRLEQEIQAAMACPDTSALEAHLKERFDSPLPDWIRYLEGDERGGAVRARIEGILRSELVHFEQALLLQTLDQTWKDHLYAMDMLRDNISFRGYAQQDPRIEYKREGSRLFNQMLELVRERVTDDFFKVRLMPAMPPAPMAAPIGAPSGQRQPPPLAPPGPARPAPVTQRAGGTGGGGISFSTIAGPGMISGPGISDGPASRPEPAPQPAAAATPPEPSPPLSPKQRADLAKAARAADRTRERSR
jgi:preprotein translocase subunit SecA